MGSYQIGMGLQGFVQGATDFAKIFMGLLQLQQEQEYKDRIFRLEQNKLNMVKSEEERKAEARAAAAEFLKLLSQNTPDTFTTTQNTIQPPTSTSFKDNILYNIQAPQFINDIYNPNQLINDVYKYKIFKQIENGINPVDNFITDRSSQVYGSFPSLFATNQEQSTGTTPTITDNTNAPTMTKEDLNNKKYELLAKMFEKDPTTASALLQFAGALTEGDREEKKRQHDINMKLLEYQLKNESKLEKIVVDNKGYLHAIIYDPKTQNINKIPLGIKDSDYELNLQKMMKDLRNQTDEMLKLTSGYINTSITTSLNALTNLFKKYSMGNDIMTRIMSWQNNPEKLNIDSFSSLYNDIQSMPEGADKKDALTIYDRIKQLFKNQDEIKNELLKRVGIKTNNNFYKSKEFDKNNFWKKELR